MCNIQAERPNIDEHIKRYLWEDCTIGIECVCGETQILDSERGIIECECGRRFSVRWEVRVWQSVSTRYGN